MITSNVLEHIVGKSTVVETYSSESLLEVPDAVYDNYEKYLNTYIPIGDSEFDNRFSQSILKGKIVKGYISAPFGYGKTSKCISMWDHCRKKNILAVPPFKFDSKLDGIIVAVHAWVKHVFRNKYPDYVPKIDEIYSKYQIQSKEKYIEELSKGHKITFGEASKIVDDMINKGSLNIKVTPKILMNYLKEINLLISGKFEGIALFIDEVQGINDTSIINDLRNFVFELGIQEMKLGVMFIIPDAQEEDLMRRAGDLLDRLKKDQCYLNLASNFEQKFAKNLWLEYSKKYLFEPYELVSEDCLDALGEISSRDDLSRGPRTIIEVFKRICINYKPNNQPYTVLDMISDILNDNIQYIQPKYIKVLNESLSFPDMDTEAKKNVIKLLCAFPFGIKTDRISSYGLSGSFDYLVDKFYTTLIKYTVNGYTLAGLEKESAADFLTQHVIKFRSLYGSNDQTCQDDLIKCFVRYMIPEIFEKRSGTQLMGWIIDHNFPTTGGQNLELTGTFDKNYPYRSVRTSVILEGENHGEYFQNISKDGIYDMEFIFNLIVDEKRIFEEDTIIFENEDKIIININMLKKVANDELPGELKRLQTCIQPKDVTPMFLLCLLYYFHSLETKEYIQNQGDIKSMEDLLVRYSKRFLFDNELRAKYDLKMNYEKIIEELFKKVCTTKYSKYETIIHTHLYSKDLKYYKNYLKNCTISQSRGYSKIETNKNDLVTKITGNKSPSVSGFKDDCTIGKWKNFIQLIEWGKNDKISFKFKLHPLESDIWKIFENNDSDLPISKEKLANYAYELGYLHEEFEEIIQIMIARRYFEELRGFLVKAENISNSDVLSRFNETFEFGQNVAAICIAYGTKPDLNIEMDLIETIKSEKNPEMLQVYDEKIKGIKRHIESQLRFVKGNIDEDKKNLVEDFSKLNEDILRSLKKCTETGDLKTSSDSLLDIVKHLNKQLKDIRSEYESLRVSSMNSLEGIHSSDALKKIAEIVNSKKSEHRKFRKEYSEIEDKIRKWHSWKVLIDKLELISDKIENYVDLDLEQEKDDFKRIINEICGGFAETQNQYLVKNIEVLNSNIESLSNNIMNKEGSLKSSFNKVIEDINRNLRRFNDIEFIKNSSNIAKVDAVFSIEDKNKSYTLLESGTKRVLKNMCEEFKNYLESLKTEINLKLPENEKKDFLDELGIEYNKLNDILTAIDILDIFDEKLSENIDNIINIISDSSDTLKNLDLNIKKAQRDTIEKEHVNPILTMINSKGELKLNEIIKNTGMGLDEVISCIKDIYRGSLAEIILRKK
jgi:hypothetical protein